MSCEACLADALKVTFLPVTPSTYMSLNRSFALCRVSPFWARLPVESHTSGADMAVHCVRRAEVDDDGSLGLAPYPAAAYRAAAKVRDRQLLTSGDVPERHLAAERRRVE